VRIGGGRVELLGLIACTFAGCTGRGGGWVEVPGWQFAGLKIFRL
jgi:hypothetical protein